SAPGAHHGGSRSGVGDATARANRVPRACGGDLPPPLPEARSPSHDAPQLGCRAGVGLRSRPGTHRRLVRAKGARGGPGDVRGVAPAMTAGAQGQEARRVRGDGLVSLAARPGLRRLLRYASHNWGTYLVWMISTLGYVGMSVAWPLLIGFALAA